MEKHSTPLAEATTTSLEALKAFSLAFRVNVTSGVAASIPHYRRTLEIDPNFALAHAHLALAYNAAGEAALSAESARRAWELRDRVSDYERFYIDFGFHRHVTGNLEEAYQTLQRWLQAYPRRGGSGMSDPHGLLGGISTQGTGRFETTMKAGQETIDFDPDRLFGYSNLAGANYYLDRFDAAEAAIRLALERKLEDGNLRMVAYNIAAIKGDANKTDRMVALAKGNQAAERLLGQLEALALARSGRLEASRQSSKGARDLAVRMGDREVAARFQASQAVWEALCGNAEEGKRNALEALELSKSRDVEYAAALALGFAGKHSQSEAIADDLEKRFPKDTFAVYTYVPVLRGLAALRQGKPAESVEHLQDALRYQFAVNGLNFSTFSLGGLHSAYVRGEALAALRRYPEALAEYKKILDHRGLVGPDPLGALAHLQQGRVFALSGDKGNAKASYELFLDMWKDADPGVPILKLAKAEYAKLR